MNILNVALSPPRTIAECVLDYAALTTFGD